MAAPAINVQTSSADARNAAPVIWYFALAAVTFALLAPTTVPLFETWTSSANYIHGLFALAVSFALVWSRRKTLVFTNAPALPIAGLVISACLIFWLIAYHGEINFLAQIAHVLTLIAAFWGLFGLRQLSRFAAPLGVLFFAIPLGDGLLPPLQHATAWIAETFLRVAGIQHTYDHPYFMTGAARFHISEACAGMNFVSMALMAAYLLSMKYRLTRARSIVLLLSAASIAVLMNGLRAFAVIAGVTIAPQTALATDHLWLGLALFAPVLLALAATAARLAATSMREPQPDDASPEFGAEGAPPPVRNFALITLLLALFSVGAFLANAN